MNVGGRRVDEVCCFGKHAHIQVGSVRLTAVMAFPNLRLSATVTRPSMRVNSSSSSITLSKRIVTDAHISAPLLELGANVNGMDSAMKSPSSAVAANK